MANILVLTSRWPFPPHGGDKIRVLEICRQLASKHVLTLVAACESGEGEVLPEDGRLFSRIERVVIPRWRSYVGAGLGLLLRRPLQVSYYRSGRYKEVVERLIGNADLVLAHLIRTAQYIPSEYSGVRILEITDAISLALRRAAEVGRAGRFMMAVSKLESRRVEAYEKECMKRFHVLSVVSAVDCRYLLKLGSGGRAKLLIATNGVTPRHVKARAFGDAVVFVGHMRTLPNLDACDFFIEECLPVIRLAYPEIIFRIIGPISPRIAERLRARALNIEVIGEVEEIEAHVGDAFCGVAPMRRGAGIQNKILEYMALGLPCVTTPTGYEGLQAKVGDEIVVRESAAGIAEAIIALKRDPLRRSQIAEAARGYIEARHNWRMCLAPLMDEIDSRCDDGGAAGSGRTVFS